MFKGVMFDLDGTLVDTMPIWDEAIGEVFAAAGFPYNREIYKRIMQTPIDQVAEQLKQEFDLSVGVEEMLTPLTDTFLRLARAAGIQKTSGADAFIDALVSANIPFAIATSSCHKVTEEILALVGWQHRFPLIVDGDDIVDDKPSPDVFAEAARRLACDPQMCIAFEDSPKGVASAQAAGLQVIGIDDPRFGLDLSATNRVITSFDQVTIADLQKLAQAK